MGNTRDLGQILGVDAIDLHTGVAVAPAGHHLTFDQRGRLQHAGHLPHRIRQCGVIGDTSIERAGFGDFAMGVDRGMGVGAQNGTHEFRPKA